MLILVIAVLLTLYLLSVIIVGLWLYRSLSQHSGPMTHYDWYMSIVFAGCPVLNSLIAVCLCLDAFCQSLKGSS